VTDPTERQQRIMDDPSLRRVAPRPGWVDLVRQNAAIVLAPVLVLLVLAVAAGLIRKPTYTSEARLSVGGLSLTQETIPGYTVAVQYLAIAYARAIDANSVVSPVARKLHLSPSVIASQISATPIQGSPVVNVDATAKDAGQAVRLADAMSDSLTRYAVNLNSGNVAAQHLLARYRSASRALTSATQALTAAPPHSAQARAAQTQVDLDRLQLQTTGALYGQSQAGQANENLVQKLAPAGPATSDRSSVLQRYLAAALLAGLLIGVGLAIERANRLQRRRLAG
jgi:capsular polysaccharide biosynthesis protein